MKKLLLFYPLLLLAPVLLAQSFTQGASNFGLSAGTQFLSFADLDHDGDMDAFSTSSTNHNIFLQNSGTKYSAAFTVGPYDFNLEPTTTGIDFVDIDNDGDLDAWSVNGGLGALGTSFWLNTGNYAAPSFTNGQPNYGITGAGYDISFVDIDSDGDMDAFMINGSNGTSFWRNIGSANTPSFTSDVNFGLLAKGTSIDFADLDGDGDADAFSIDSSATYWTNTGSKYAPAFAIGQSNLGLNATGTGLSFVDIDSDGDADAFSINSTGGATYWENTSVVTGIKNQSNMTNGAAWPNPFTTVVTISTGQTLTNATFVLYDICGKPVKVVENISGTGVSINRESLPNGIYMYHLNQNNKIIASGKLVAE